MGNDDMDVTSLLRVREKIDLALSGYMGKVTALKKRREALQTAIDVLRSQDDDLIEEAPKPKARVFSFDTRKVEDEVLNILRQAGGPAKQTWISGRLTDAHMEFSELGLKRILNTSPSIRREGQRERTKYSLNVGGANG